MATQTMRDLRDVTDDEILQHPRLRWADKGLALWLKRHPGATPCDAARHGPTGRTALYTMARRLRDVGFLAGFKAEDEHRAPPRRGFLYVAHSAFLASYKIGKSIDPARRIRRLSPYYPFDVRLVLTIPTEDMHREEAALHSMFASRHTAGEWFDLSAGDVQTLRQLRGAAAVGEVTHV